MYLLEALLERGETKVRGFSRSRPRRWRDTGAELMLGSVADYEAVKEACRGVDVVFLTAANLAYHKRLTWQYAAAHEVNVTGAENVARACVECGVQVLVYTSSSSVVASRQLPVNLMMDESSPTVDAQTSPNHYGWTKVQGERAVLSANGAELPSGAGRLAVASLRLWSNVFGHGDIVVKYNLDLGIFTSLTDAVLDSTYVENAVWAHLLAETALRREPGRVGGMAYDISNCEPMTMYKFVKMISFFYHQATGSPTFAAVLPGPLAAVIAMLVELYNRATHKQPPGLIGELTPATVELASLNYACTGRRAREVLGYTPLFTVAEGVQKTVEAWYQERQETMKHLK